jgi:hypothetical protein
MKQQFDTLDELAAEFPPGETFRFQAGTLTKIATVVGYVYSLPLTKGGRKEPALVVTTDFGLGNVYPHEIVKRMEK